MKISAALLLKDLGSKFSFEVIGPVGTELEFERIMFLSSRMALEESCIYLLDMTCTINIPEAEPTDALLFCIGSPSDSLREIFKTIFICPPDVSLLELHNEIQVLLSFYDRWDKTLQSILNTGGGVQEMIDCSADIFNNPILLHNRSFVIIACSPAYKEYPEAQNAASMGNHISIDLETTKRDEEFNRTYSTVRASIFSAHLTGFRTLYMNLFFLGCYEYRLLVIESAREFRPSDGPLLEHLAYFMKLAISADKTEVTADVMTLPHVLKSILNDNLSDPYYIEQKLNEYNWLSQHRYFCLKLMVDILDMQNHTLGLLCNNIVALLTGSCAFAFDSGIVVYVNLDLFGGSRNDAVNRIKYYLRDNNLKSGISNEFTELSELKLYHRQAEIALSVGLRNKPHIWIHRFADITELFLLQSCTSQLPGRMVCAQELLVLQKYDEAHDTEFYRTLSVYLKNNLHHVQTAKDLYIHRSTFLYRLDRIREITGIDFNDFSKRWYILLSLKLMDMSDRKN